MNRYLATLFIGYGLCLGTAQSDTISLFAAAGVKAPAEVIIKQFEASTGQHRAARLRHRRCDGI
jgi:ABC-type molybdate transport system substrate-binding protein